MLYLSAQVSVGDAETAGILVLTNTFNGPECKSVPGSIRKYNGVTAYVCRLTVRLTGRVVGRVGAHTGGPPLITMGEGFKSASIEAGEYGTVQHETYVLANPIRYGTVQSVQYCTRTGRWLTRGLPGLPRSTPRAGGTSTGAAHFSETIIYRRNCPTYRAPVFVRIYTGYVRN